MPHATSTEYQHIELKKLAPTFAAEVKGVDFSKPIEKDVFDEIHRSITDVSFSVLTGSLRFTVFKMPYHPFQSFLGED